MLTFILILKIQTIFMKLKKKIVQAISSTIQRDPTAAHYKYHDDPYLIPVSNFQKRAYALSQESGRKSAQWIRNQHPDLFNHKVAFPPIEV